MEIHESPFARTKSNLKKSGKYGMSSLSNLNPPSNELEMQFLGSHKYLFGYIVALKFIGQLLR